MKLIVALILTFLRPGFGFSLGGLGDIVGGLGSFLGGHREEQQAKSAFDPTSGMEQANAWWQQIMPLLTGRQEGVAGQIDPQFLSSFQQMLGIDPSALIGAGSTAGSQYDALANLGKQYGGALGGAGMAGIGRGQDIWNRAQDPQNQQYNVERNKAMENVRGAESARGIAMGGQGAGLESDALRNFDIDWKNFQDQRMLNANQAVNQSNYMAQENLGGAMDIGGAVPGYTMASAQAPIAGRTAAAQFPAQAASSYAGNVYGSDPYAAILAQLGSYMGHTYPTFGLNRQQTSGMVNEGINNMSGGFQGILGGLGKMFAM